MADVRAIHSVGASIVGYLRDTYPADLRGLYPCGFRPVSSGQLADMGEVETSLLLYLYRITINEHIRNTRRPQAPDSPPPLALDLHYLMMVWTENPVAEHVIMGWAMNQLYLRSVLDTSLLSAGGGWSEQEQLQIYPEELSTEDLMRIWDALEPSYRLSASYVVRSVQISNTDTGEGRVAAVRLELDDDLRRRVP